MSCRFPVLTTLLSLFTVLGAGGREAGEAAEAWKVERVWTEYRGRESFDTFSVATSGEENASGAIILRTRPESREGFYFLVHLRGPGLAEAGEGMVNLHIVMPDAAKARVYSLPFPMSTGRSLAFRIGVTGADWPVGATMPLAWKIEFTVPDGAGLASTQSFLWEMPDEGLP